MLVKKHFKVFGKIKSLLIIFNNVSFSLLLYFYSRYLIFCDMISGGYGIFSVKNISGWRF